MTDHQDWKPVVFKKPTTSSAPSTGSTSGGSKPHSYKPQGPKIRLTEDGEEYVKIKSGSTDEGKRLARYRTAAKLTQKSLANSIGVKLKDLQDMESGKIPLGKYKMKLSRYLNVLVDGKPYVVRQSKVKK